MNHYQLQYDVVVIGAGPGGIPAALAAARNGAKVLLVERSGFIGGNICQGLPFLGYLDSKGRQVVGGIAHELIEDLTARGGSFGHRPCPIHNSVTVVHPDMFKLLAAEKLREAGVDLLLHTEVIDTEVISGRLRRITLFGKCNRIAVEAAVFIDATGDGDLAYMAGCEYEMGQRKTGELQPATVMFLVGGVDEERFFRYLDETPANLSFDRVNHAGQTVRIGKGYDTAYLRGGHHLFVGLTELVKDLTARGECAISQDIIIWCNSMVPGAVCFNCTRVRGLDATDIFDLTRGELETRAQIPPFVEMMRKHVPGFENSHLISIAPTLGVRESRRFMGEKYLTGDCILLGDIPADTVALGAYGIDVHSDDNNAAMYTILDGAYGIPYGCLVSRNVKGLMFSGRLISVDAEVLGSMRVIATCMAVGEAAGVGAALAAAGKCTPAEVDPAEVAAILLRNKAILS